MAESIYIRAWGDYYAPVDTDAGVPALKELVREALGEPVRRVGRFIQLALIGAGRCAGGRALPAETAVYFTSGRGDLEVTLEVWESLFRQGLPPKPLSFINTVSNSACYYIARQFGLHGRSSFVCNRHFAFESALQLALLELENGGVHSALTGAVDMVVPPFDEHRERLHLAPDAPLAEGSHWLWLQRGAAGEAAPRLLAARHFSEREALLQWLDALPQPAQTTFAAGQFLAAADAAALAPRFAEVFDYRAGRGYYDSQSAAAISAWLQAPAAQPFLLHLNGDPEGRYAALLVAR
jgi:hypothetical protein